MGSLGPDSDSRHMLFLPKSARIHKPISVYKCKHCNLFAKKVNTYIVRDGPVDHGFCNSDHALAWLQDNQYVLDVKKR
jgi:hypothetical protein